MTDDKIHRLHPRAREVTCTHVVPSEAPDAPHMTDAQLERGGLRRVALPADLADFGHNDLTHALESIDRAIASLKSARAVISEILGDDGGDAA